MDVDAYRQRQLRERVQHRPVTPEETAETLRCAQGDNAENWRLEVMASWLYPISERAGQYFLLKDGHRWPVSVDTYRTLVENHRLVEDHVWDIKTNFHNVRPGDEIYVYMPDQDLGIVGYATVNRVVQDGDEWDLDLKFDLEKCELLLRDLPINAQLVRKWVYPRAAVVSLELVEPELKKRLPWKNDYTPPKQVTDRQKQNGGGGGFGDPEKNRKVEEAAVRKVTKDFQKSGWKVESVEKLRMGFDLLCMKDDLVRKVEVKGVSGDTPSFILTAGELRASDDENFELHVVLNALSKTPLVKKWTGKQMKKAFSFTPIQLFAALKN
jgi:hypothetical protein